MDPLGSILLKLINSMDKQSHAQYNVEWNNLFISQS